MKRRIHLRPVMLGLPFCHHFHPFELGFKSAMHTTSYQPSTSLVYIATLIHCSNSPFVICVFHHHFVCSSLAHYACVFHSNLEPSSPFFTIYHSLFLGVHYDIKPSHRDSCGTVVLLSILDSITFGSLVRPPGFSLRRTSYLH